MILWREIITEFFFPLSFNDHKLSRVRLIGLRDDDCTVVQHNNYYYYRRNSVMYAMDFIVYTRSNRFRSVVASFLFLL